LFLANIFVVSDENVNYVSAGRSTSLHHLVEAEKKAFLFQQQRDAHARSMLRGRVGRVNIEGVMRRQAMAGATNRSVSLPSRLQRGPSLNHVTVALTQYPSH